MKRWRVDGQRALVTGGTRGIGAAVVAELRGLGATVLTVARSGADISADISEDGAADRVISAACEKLGGLEILVNNVGTNVRKPTLMLSEAEIETVLTTNLTAALGLCKAAQASLAESRGCIVNIGSVAGNVAIGTGVAYAMSKAALDQLTRYLAVEWAGVGVRVNSVNPFYTKTPLAQPVLDDPERLARVLASTPLGRIAEPEDIAAAVAFFCLPAARHITGQCLAVDGGFLARGSYLAGEPV
ncbi:SDR family oxidoreductase [Armatimonas sp.]|uniref:SDR family oxidoreductase n=1 Tax=Armatimonas sp. TaxID=1872638 RepID=UPI00286A8353|nr:SDR family oxidoreductase [Armatimonas sp.]